MPAPLSTVSLAGAIVRLDPLTLAHAAPLAEVGLEPELWTLQPRPVETEADMRRYVEQALDDQARGVSLPFAIVHRTDERVIGSTRYMDIAMAHRRLEIGATWIAPAWQRSGANVEAKLLLLTHAFEVLGVQKVVFKTETLNAQSRRAILALGSVEEGTFRKHLIADNGRARDMVYFSILDTEWPTVRDRLQERLQRRAQPQPNA
ncbi:MAG TPA: GNAT family protein [Mizugakiibacter sp.]